jgi:hypothetical protein
LRRDRASEILSQLTEFFPFFDSICDLNLSRRGFTLELLTALRHVIVLTQMRVKHALAAPRPVDFSPQIMPMIQTPGHSSFPAGHAVEAFAFATVLAELTAARESVLYGGARPIRDQLMRVAARISVNRVVAGVHFPVDMAAGMVMGTTLAKFFVASLKGSTTPLRSWTFNAENYAGEDFLWREMLAAIDGNNDSLASAASNGAFLTSEQSGFTPSLLSDGNPVRWFWDRAAAEWQA